MKKTSISAHRCLCMRALKAMPSFQLVVKFVMLTFGYLHNKSQGMSLSLHNEEMQPSNNVWCDVTQEQLSHLSVSVSLVLKRLKPLCHSETDQLSSAGRLD